MIKNFDTFKNCQLCPRDCRIDRTRGEIGYCGETAQLRIATIEAHFGEEPPISGTNGSGTVFFTGCSLKCNFCQNFQISQQNLGDETTIEKTVQQLKNLIDHQQIHNINFVTPDHFFPYCIEIVQQLRNESMALPAVFNLSGYQSIQSLKMIENYADIYLPDYKYSDARLAQKFSHSVDYPQVALLAIEEMIKQKGFLNTFLVDSEKPEIARQGVLIRHLILPGYVQNSIEALTSLFIEFGTELPISLMSQFTPISNFKPAELSRKITPREFDEVYEHVQNLGFKNLFVQFLNETSNSHENPLFLPDFTQNRPFKGNIQKKAL
ncbi:4Fe-4S cluster-binding domain-containing protein [candidate division KSB1 bacterium]|nr:4Fe-4S cluster-binding domain-containing protein [candidate division KSB1 bacterium]